MKHERKRILKENMIAHIRACFDGGTDITFFDYKDEEFQLTAQDKEYINKLVARIEKALMRPESE